jgi:hypothetical protein
MKITVNQLRKIIKEEISRVLAESDSSLEEYGITPEVEKKMYRMYHYDRHSGRGFNTSLKNAVVSVGFKPGAEDGVYDALIGKDNKPNKGFAEAWEQKYPESSLNLPTFIEAPPSPTQKEREPRPLSQAERDREYYYARKDSRRKFYGR